MIGNLFTPRLADGARARMRLSDEDFEKIGRGKPWEATITVLVTGRRYAVQGAECSAGAHCFCDAVIVGEVS